MSEPRSDIVYQSTKTYTHAHGLSCCFRQWKADSHCNTLHGYSLQIEVTFEGPLDQRNWVMDFGGLKRLKGWLESTFDHKTLVAEDDPQYALFVAMGNSGLIDMVTVPAVGCEKFAEQIYDWLDGIPNWEYDDTHPKVQSVKVSEHPGNSATVHRKPVRVKVHHAK